MPTWQAFVGLLLAKWYDNKLVKSPYNCVISPLTQPQVANQKKKKKKIDGSRSGLVTLLLKRPVTFSGKINNKSSFNLFMVEKVCKVG